MNEKELNVVFLIWVPYGIKYLESFIKSYLSFPSNVEHDLVILFNGCQNDGEIEEYHRFLKNSGISYSYLIMRSGQDILAYRFAAENLSSKYLLFFNTYAEILSDNWGLYYLNTIKAGDVGLAGATGSWQSKSSWVFQRVRWIFASESAIKKNISYFASKKVKIGPVSLLVPPRLTLLGALIKSLPDIFSYPYFPNAHLRTNSFIVERTFWLDFRFNSVRNKKEAYRMESGNNSFTRQTIQKGKKVLIINRLGQTFEPSKWVYSGTSWIGDQENLLVSDNFTKLYQQEDGETRITMSKSVWGNHPEIKKNNFSAGAQASNG